ncbi:MAG TPA: hypothetical protein P5274_01430, partial [Candidatus Paceibacterota bacterium]|nr:hypothetical protein [Candidatus Paceibacterota bacterium]
MFTKYLKLITLVAILSLVLLTGSVALAQTMPNTPGVCSTEDAANFPGCNPPINVGSTIQTRKGDLVLEKGLSLNGVLQMWGDLKMRREKFISFDIGYFSNSNINRIFADALGVLNIYGGKNSTTVPGPLNVKIYDNLNVAATTTSANIQATNNIYAKSYYVCATPTSCTSFTGSTGDSQWTPSGTNIYNNNTGNVGVGKSNPSYKLDVAGAIGWGSPANRGVLGYFDDKVSLRFDSKLYFGALSSSKQLVTLTKDGLFGIGTNDPVTELDVRGDVTVSGTTTVNGRVGIGTKSPVTKLEVSGNGYNNSRINVRSTDADPATVTVQADNSAENGDRAILGKFGSTGDANANQAFITNIGTGAINFYQNPATNPTPVMTLDGNTNVGIGTTSVATGLKLNVAGKVGATEYCDEKGENCKVAAALGGDSNWAKDINNNITNTNTGKVGVGMTPTTGPLSPQQKLQVRGGIYLAEGHITGMDEDGLKVQSYLAGIDMKNVDEQNGQIAFTTAKDRVYSEKMRVTSDGSVGIGVTGPTAKLHIGTVEDKQSLRIEGPSSANGAQVSLSLGGNGEVQVDKPGVVGGRFIIKDNGKVGIGTALPESTLDVVGTVRSGALIITNLGKNVLGNVIDLGADTVGREQNAGKIAYEKFGDQNALDIVGAGTENGNRLVRIYDNLSVNGTTTTNTLVVNNVCTGTGDDQVCNSTLGDGNWVKTDNNISNSNTGGVGIGTTDLGAKLTVNSLG